MYIRPQSEIQWNILALLLSPAPRFLERHVCGVHLLFFRHVEVPFPASSVSLPPVATPAIVAFVRCDHLSIRSIVRLQSHRTFSPIYCPRPCCPCFRTRNRILTHHCHIRTRLRHPRSTCLILLAQKVLIIVFGLEISMLSDTQNRDTPEPRLGVCGGLPRGAASGHASPGIGRILYPFALIE